ncbi:hypothetical protein ACROYT_G028635 [Oculina patagonica]
MNICFIDFKKAFDSVRRHRLWNILKHYGIPENFVNIIRELYDGSTCCVVERGQISDWFPVGSGVKQGCVMFGFLFNIIIDRIMQNTNNARRGLRWKFTTVLEDLDYADDIALLSSRHKDLQEKFNRLHQVSRYTGLCINTIKTKVLRTNTKVANPISINGQDVEKVSSFIYLGATVQGGRTKERPISKSVKVRQWRWIGHILRREKDNNCRVALTWTPEGKRQRGRPKISWRITVEGERKDLGWTSWNEAEQRAKDREGWRTFPGSLMLQLEERRG